MSTRADILNKLAQRCAVAKTQQPPCCMRSYWKGIEDLLDVVMEHAPATDRSTMVDRRYGRPPQERPS